MGLLGSTKKVNQTSIVDFDAQTQARDGATAVTGEGNITSLSYQVVDSGAVNAARDTAITALAGMGQLAQSTVASNAQLNAHLADTFAGQLSDISGVAFDFGDSALNTTSAALQFADQASDRALSFASGVARPDTIDPALIKLATVGVIAAAVAFTLRG